MNLGESSEKEGGMKQKSYLENERFENMTLTEEELIGKELTACTFVNCVLENCKFTACKIMDCSFEGCRIINPVLERSSMMDCTFSRCSLLGVNWSALLGGGYLIPIAALYDCQLKYNHFVEINFAKFDFSGNAIIASLFADCNLSGSRFTQCELDRTEFFRCDLTKADFRNAAGYVIDLETNVLKRARFSFPEVVNLLQATGIIIE